MGSLPTGCCAETLSRAENIGSVKMAQRVGGRGLTRALEGRGFRGLGGPVEDAGITNNVVHAGKTSRQGPCVFA